MPASPHAINEPGRVWRIGYAPEPWNWTDWAYATDGRFGGRWDAPDGTYRTVYAGTTLRGCLLEVLARFRPDPAIAAEMDDINEDDVDAELYGTVAAGVVDRSWFAQRRISSATLTGRYCDVASANTIAALRPRFYVEATAVYGLADFDAAALHDSRPRELTQRVGQAVYEMAMNDGGPFDGLRFLSRHGADNELWAIYERSTDGPRSAHLHDITTTVIDPGSDDVLEVLALFDLRVD